MTELTYYQIRLDHRPDLAKNNMITEVIHVRAVNYFPEVNQIRVFGQNIHLYIISGRSRGDSGGSREPAPHPPF